MVEKIRYRVLRKIDDLEIRQYPSIILATVEGKQDNSAFRILFDYIQGSNKTRKKVPMTAPVISSERIPMTAPVVSSEETFSFVLPEGTTLGSAPIPLNERIKVHKIPERKLAVLGFGGRVNDGLLSRKNNEFISILKKNGIPFKGPPFLMRYNSPFMPGPFRKNEVAVELLNS